MKYLTTKEASELLGKSQRRIQEMANQGKFIDYKKTECCGKIYISEKEIKKSQIINEVNKNKDDERFKSERKRIVVMQGKNVMDYKNVKVPEGTMKESKQMEKELNRHKKSVNVVDDVFGDINNPSTGEW